MGICVFVFLAGLFVSWSFGGEYGADDVEEKLEFEKWDSEGRLISPRLRHFHPQFPSFKDDSELNGKYSDHSRKRFNEVNHPHHLDSKNYKDSKNKTTCRDETQIHNDTEKIVCPQFATVIENVTQAVGRDAKLECVVDNLGRFRVAWMRVETQTVLTMHRHVISRNYRITLSHSEHRVYVLHINNVQEGDRGKYMCQVNTVPMLFQIVYLDVVVPPEIVEENTSSDMFSREGSDVDLKCAARGRPTPKLIWRREDYKPIVSGNWQDSKSQSNLSVYEGSELTINRVSRLHMGAYLCIASNGVPPAMSRRIQLQVNFPPMIWIPNQLIGASLRQNVTIECHTEAHPESINYWSRHDSEIINPGSKFEMHYNASSYKVHMILIVHDVVHSDYGAYTCFARNFLGTTEGTIRLYEIHVPHPVKEPSTAKIQSLDGTSANNDVPSPTDLEEDLEVPRDSKYPNTSLKIPDEGNHSPSISCGSGLVVAAAALTVIAARSYLEHLGT